MNDAQGWALLGLLFAAFTTIVGLVNARLGDIIKRLDRMETRLDRTDTKLGELDGDVRALTFHTFGTPGAPREGE